ncbi:fructosamine kinase family protein [Virgibacillus senegalensis]|uniref:fructosamine kinase family protein n=1 Tax=Virgibacillus senegalensis TaxID=1499679 RepID=UPI00069F3FD1|nr:fructosamine kinase family protein [Virgibacillus senegalensis]
MEQQIRKKLELIGDSSNVQALRQVSGGDINKTYYVRTEEREYFIKGNQNVPPHFFRVEAKGLLYIKETKTVPVPDVLDYDEPENGEVGLLVMDWISGSPSQTTTEQLGRKVAAMHGHQNTQHGFEDETFIGALPQPNGLFDSWLTYYREHRLQPQFHTAVTNGRMPETRRKQMAALLDRLDDWIPSTIPASLLHGDLWGGNWLPGPEGEPFLIDPSVLYGDRLFELAFTEVFGGFPDDFYNAYEELSPLPDYYPEVKPLYQLYYLLVHLNMFGEAYGHSVDRILSKYIG